MMDLKSICPARGEVTPCEYAYVCEHFVVTGLRASKQICNATSPVVQQGTAEILLLVGLLTLYRPDKPSHCTVFLAQSMAPAA